jgi:predicted O-methyltransferase YrrM
VDEKILRVLNRLGKQSKLERSGDLKVLPGDEMLAITPDTGMFFKIILNAMHAKRILEIGTSVGYSTLWFADAIIQNGVTRAEDSNPIITIDINHSKIEKATNNFHDAEVNSIIKVVEGSAMSILQEMSNNSHRETDIKKTDGLFDFVFFDADKENLRDYFDLVIPMLRVGGVVATDNMLYPEEYRPLMLNYASYVRSKPYIESIMVPIGNGEEITIKLASSIIG